MMTLKTGVSFAASAAIVAMGAATTAPAFAADGASQIHCYGVNTCKGTSDCKTAAHECKGQNECKGQGFKVLSAKQCAKDGGSTTEAK